MNMSVQGLAHSWCLLKAHLFVIVLVNQVTCANIIETWRHCLRPF